MAANIAIDAATTILASWSLLLGSWVIVASLSADPVGAAEVADLINTIVRISLAATIVLTAVELAFEARRYVRLGRTGS